MIATGIISNIICLSEVQNTQKQPVHSLKSLTGLFPPDLYLINKYFVIFSDHYTM